MADPSKLGMEFPVYSIRVEKNKIVNLSRRSSRRTTRNRSTLFTDVDAAKKAGFENIPTPPTFSTSYVFWTGGGLLGTIKAVGADLSKLLHTGRV